MRIRFYIKLLIAFISFSLIIFIFASTSFSDFYKSHNKKNEVNTVFQTIEYNKKIIDIYFNSIQNKLESINESEVLLKYLKNKENKINLTNIFDSTISSDKNILQISFLNLNAKEEIRINKYFKEKKTVNQSNLQNKINTTSFKKIRSLKENNIWISDITLNKDFGEISSPLSYIIQFVIRNSGGFIILTFDVKEIFQIIEKSFDENLYILDENGNFLLHDEFSWSKYFYPNETIHKTIPLYSKQVLKYKSFINNDFISKRLYLTSEKYIIIFVYRNKFNLEKEFLNFKEYNYSIMIITLIITILLSMILTTPIMKSNKKILDKNRDLDLTIKKNSQDLNESLEIIDKHVMAYEMDKEGNIINVSDALCQTSGFLKEEIIGFDYYFLISSSMEPDIHNNIWYKLYKGESCSKELLNQKKDGSKYWVESYFEVVRNEKKEIIGFHVILNNITDKKIIENLYSDLNYQVGQYNAIFENVNNGIALIDLKGNFLKVNYMFTEFLGYQNDELLKMSCFDLVVKSSVKILLKIIAQAKEIGSISHIEKIFMHKDNSFIHLEISLSLLPDKSHFVLVIDSLEDKRKLQELNQNLALKIKEEVEKSRQKEKIHQEEQIKNVKLSSIGSLAAGITHEINTPLTYIKGNFEMMGYDIEDLPNSEIKTRMLEDSEKISDGLSRIANIVESMREISQSSKETKEDINIYPTLFTSLTMAYNRSKQISRIYINNKLFTLGNMNKNEYKFICNIQKERIEQVWIIIINNALDELVKIEDYEKRILNINISEKKEHILISFKDNAGGISDDIIDNLFDPFISSKEHSGMGVGLNIAKSIIEQQNGEIIAFNEKDGAVFEITLKKSTEN